VQANGTPPVRRLGGTRGSYSHSLGWRGSPVPFVNFGLMGSIREWLEGDGSHPAAHWPRTELVGRTRESGVLVLIRPVRGPSFMKRGIGSRTGESGEAEPIPGLDVAWRPAEGLSNRGFALADLGACPLERSLFGFGN
jgi:hypothetical protein